MPEIMHKEEDNSGNCTLYGIYAECKERIDSQLHYVSYGQGKHIKSVNYKVFSTIVYAYCNEFLLECLSGKKATLFNKLGELYPVKTLATRYNPTKFLFYKENGVLIKKKVKIDINKTMGYFYFIFWSAPKIYRHYRFKVSSVWQKRLFIEIQNGLDVLDITLDKYGRAASPNYIQKIK